MGGMSDYYLEQAIVDHFLQLQEQEMSKELSNRVERYSVSDEAIKELIFELSTKDLCLLADKTILDYYPHEKYDSAEMNKIIDIAAWGIANKHLTQKQKWNLASFIIYYTRKGEM